jgi:hypothetical protein
MNFRKIFMSVLAALFLINFTGCSSDDVNDQDSPKVSGLFIRTWFFTY